jgi:hypothetical protein
VDQERGIISGRLLEAPALTVSTPGLRLATLAASLLLVQDALQLRHTNRAALDKVAGELQGLLGGHLGQRHEAVTFAHFGEVIMEALAFPTGPTSAQEFEPKLRDHVARYFEGVWLHRPLKSLGGVPPIDAAGHPPLRKRLLGVIQFLHDCLQASAPRITEGEGAGTNVLGLYDFDRLRHKLGLGAPAPGGPAAAAAEPDIDAMSAADLAALPAEQLPDGQLERAFRAALKLDTRDLAGGFARTLVARPASAERPDRYPFFSHLVQLRLDEGDSAGALAVLDQAIAADAAQNEGKRQNDYELRKGQILAKSGQAEAAAAQFEQLAGRGGVEPKYLGSAAEALLGARQGARARKLAEQGLAQARARNSRDLEEYFLELVAAAKKQGG